MDVQTVQDQDEVIDNLEQKEVIENDKPLSVREELANALAATKAPEKPEPEAKPDKPRAEDGKFAKVPKEPKVKEVSHESQPEPVKVVTPKSLPAALLKEFSAVPKAVQDWVVKREDEFHKELTKHDEERVFGRSVKELASPYIPLIKAEGGDLVKAFGSYLNTAYVLRTKTPQEKGQLLLQLAREYGADLQGASQAQPQANPVIHQLQQELQGLKGTIEQEKALKKQQEDEARQQQINAFAADPKHVHFETVKPHMAALLKSGLAKDLQDAYDQAVYANPHTRSTLQQQNTADEQRVANQKAKAEAAKRAGSSLKGSPGIAASKNGRIVEPDLRKAITSAFAEHRGEA